MYRINPARVLGAASSMRAVSQSTTVFRLGGSYRLFPSPLHTSPITTLTSASGRIMGRSHVLYAQCSRGISTEASDALDSALPGSHRSSSSRKSGDMVTKHNKKGNVKPKRPTLDSLIDQMIGTDDGPISDEEREEMKENLIVSYMKQHPTMSRKQVERELVKGLVQLVDEQENGKDIGGGSDSESDRAGSSKGGEVVSDDYKAALVNKAARQYPHLSREEVEHLVMRELDTTITDNEESDVEDGYRNAKKGSPMDELINMQMKTKGLSREAAEKVVVNDFLYQMDQFEKDAKLEAGGGLDRIADDSDDDDDASFEKAVSESREYSEFRELSTKQAPTASKDVVVNQVGEDTQMKGEDAVVSLNDEESGLPLAPSSEFSSNPEYHAKAKKVFDDFSNSVQEEITASQQPVTFEELKLTPVSDGSSGEPSHAIYLNSPDNRKYSFWHHTPLVHKQRDPLAYHSEDHFRRGTVFNYVVTTPLGQRSIYEFGKCDPYNPLRAVILQRGDDDDYDFHIDEYEAPVIGTIGLLPQTYLDSEGSCNTTGFRNKGNAVDVIDVSRTMRRRGDLVLGRILGAFGFVDYDTIEWRMVMMPLDDPLAPYIHDEKSLEICMPGRLAEIKSWLKKTKKASSRGFNKMLFDDRLVCEGDTLDYLVDGHAQWRDLLDDRMHTMFEQLHGGRVDKEDSDTPKIWVPKVKLTVGDEAGLNSAVAEAERKFGKGNTAITEDMTF